MSCAWLQNGSLPRDADHLLVGALLVLHVEDADHPGADAAAGERRIADQHERVERIAVRSHRTLDVAVVGGVAHRGEQAPVEHDAAHLGVPLVLVARARRDLDEHHDLVRLPRRGPSLDHHDPATGPLGHRRHAGRLRQARTRRVHRRVRARTRGRRPALVPFAGRTDLEIALDLLARAGIERRRRAAGGLRHRAAPRWRTAGRTCARAAARTRVRGRASPAWGGSPAWSSPS